MSYEIDALRQLLAAALPGFTRWEFRESWLSFDFSRLKTPLRRATQQDFVGPAVPDQWHTLHVFGEEHFDNGGALLCIDEVDGSVVRIDVESDSPLSQVNSSVAQFISSFHILNELLLAGTQSLKDVAQKLHSIDPQAFEGGSPWRLLVDYVDS